MTGTTTIQSPSIEAAVECYVAANLEGIKKRVAPKFLENAERLEKLAAELRSLGERSIFDFNVVAFRADAERLEARAARDRETAAWMMGEAQPSVADTS